MEREGTALVPREGTLDGVRLGCILGLTEGTREAEGADVLGLADREGACDEDGATDGTTDTDGWLLELGALEGMTDGAFDKVGSGLTLGAILTLGLVEVEGADDCVGLNDKVGFCDGKFDGALLMLGLLEAEGAADCAANCEDGAALELGRLDCEGVAEGPIDGCCEVPLGAFETVGLDGLDEAVGCALVLST
mmetsp:Transcript_10663/g.25756  ORF Transcript_10663/g.25756 Transcript_10663/m.25756 type:complete len:193 (-) Transcript_10663:1948-2526(-)